MRVMIVFSTIADSLAFIRRSVSQSTMMLLAIAMLAGTSLHAQTATESAPPPTQGAATAASAVDQQREAMIAFAQLDQNNNYTESLNYADMNVLPMGIKRTVGNME